MQKKHILLMCIAAWALGASIAFVALEVSYPKKIAAVSEPIPVLTHAQNVYSYALEWCESSGNPSEINPKDLDGTPSYYSFQWKPSTFKYFAVLYGVLPKSTTVAEFKKAIQDYVIQRKVIEQMILHEKNIDWSTQFPGCTKKLGLPPYPQKQT